MWPLTDPDLTLHAAAAVLAMPADPALLLVAIPLSTAEPSLELVARRLVVPCKVQVPPSAFSSAAVVAAA